MNKQKKIIIPKGLRLKALGYQWMIILCLILLVFSSWEFCVRIDAMSAPLAMFFDMALGEGIPLTTAMKYFDWKMLEPLVWLMSCMLTGLISLSVARRPIGSMCMMPICVVLSVYGLTRDGSVLPQLSYLIQPSILLAMTALNILNLSTYRIRRNRLIENIRMTKESAEESSQHEELPPEPMLLPDGLCTQTEAALVLHQAEPQYSKPYPVEETRSVRKKAHRIADEDFSDAPRLTDAPRLRRLTQENTISSAQHLDDTQSA